jgi:hypothetical protein
MAWIGGRLEAPPQPAIEQMMRGGPVKGVAVSAGTSWLVHCVPNGVWMKALAAPWRHPGYSRLERRSGRLGGVRGEWGEHAGGPWSR